VGKNVGALIPLLCLPGLSDRLLVNVNMNLLPPEHLCVIQFGAMSSLFLNNEHTLLLYSFTTFPLDNSSHLPFYSHIRSQVMMFVRNKMSDAPSASLMSRYRLVLYYLASFKGSPVSLAFFHWKYLTYGPGADSNFHYQAPNPDHHYPSSASFNASPSTNHRSAPTATLIPGTPDSIDTRSRSIATSGRFESGISGLSTSNLPPSLLTAFSHANPLPQSLSMASPTPPHESLTLHRPTLHAEPATKYYY
jgi:hypothetical protein